MKKIFIFGYVALLSVAITLALSQFGCQREPAKPAVALKTLDRIPWDDVLKCQTPAEFGVFEQKHNVHIVGYGEPMLDYVFARCHKSDGEREKFWQIFNHIGDKLAGGGDALAYARFCWMKVLDDPLVFYRRYREGDKSALEKYRIAAYYDPSSFGDNIAITKPEVLRVITSIPDEIRDAEYLTERYSIPKEERLKDADMIHGLMRQWTAEFRR
ncbi:MAG: hypothetical protein HY762_03590 [Planctomycetes bacterium]|nr:hypothetical protein [Planctomycetota bacterium]